MRMEFKCKKCGKVFEPGQFDSSCPECGSSDAEVYYEHEATKPEQE